MTLFEDLVIRPLDADSNRFCDRIVRLIKENSGWRSLEIGCGTGTTTIAVAKRRQDVKAVALDISHHNIALAKIAASEAHVSGRVHFVAEEFLNFPNERFDIIFTQSALAWMEYEDAMLAQKLKENLARGGILVCVEPYRDISSLVVILLRRAYLLFPAQIADWLAYNLAKRIYPDSENILKDRLPYMRFIPRRLDGRVWRKALTNAGLELILDEAWPSTSVAKLTHRLTIFRSGQ